MSYFSPDGEGRRSFDLDLSAPTSGYKSSADVQVEILSDDKLKSRRKKASGATLRTACLSQPCLRVGDNQSSLTASSASIREGLYPR